MPGFTIQGESPNENKFNKVEIKRKHRWRFTVGFLKQTEWIYLSKAARPSFQLEEAVMHHDQEEAYFAGKQKWEELTLEFYDVQDPDISQRVWEWVCENVAITSSATVNIPEDYKEPVEIEVTDGSGTAIEKWKLHGAWPKNTNWNELDYSSSELQTVTITLRYDRAEKVI